MPIPSLRKKTKLHLSESKEKKAFQKEKSKQKEASKKPPRGFVFIPAGSFEMGSPTTEAGRQKNEFLHPMKLTSFFYM